jgi:hypothetical protein
MPEIHCTRRKRQKTCIKDPDVCSWEDDKCVYKESRVNKPKAVRCITRKEKACKEREDICEWDGDNCFYKDKDIARKVKKAAPKKKSPDVAGPSKTKDVAGPSKIKDVAGPSKTKDVAGPSKTKPKSQDVAGPSKTKDVAGPSKTKPKSQDVAGPSKAKPKSPDVAGPSKTKPKSPDVAGPSKTKQKSPDVAGPSKTKPKSPDVAGPSRAARKSPEGSPPKLKTKSKSKSPPGSRTPSPLKKTINIESLNNRHCMLYNKEKDFSFKDYVDMKDKNHREPYNKHFKSQTNVHMGQRKLMLSEIQLLTHYYKKHSEYPLVVYVGAAPGIHLATLSNMFPHVKFILYDGAKFHESLKKNNAFELHEGRDGFFTDDTCKSIKEKVDSNNLIFVSDIRLGEENFQGGVERDMESQQRWVQMLNPKMSLLKFRMSYNMKHGEKLKYMKGKIMYGIWPKPLSGETRLLVEQADNNNIIDYDFKTYEELMFFHNKYKRPFCMNKVPEKYEKYISGAQNIYCPCYDCMLELNVLNNYSKLYNKSFDDVVTSFGKSMNWQKKVAFQNKRDAIKVNLQEIKSKLI